jgi:hypothetical protein
VNLEGKTESDQFAIEAVVKLNSLYPDASVRTIAARWNNDKGKPGWSLGVTSTKSAYKPNNLIVQLSGFDFQGSQAYEAVASGLRIPVGKPYYIAASLDNHPAPGQNFGGTVTFYVRDLSDPNARCKRHTFRIKSSVATSTKTAPCMSAVVRSTNAACGTERSPAWHCAPAMLDAGKLMTWAVNSDPTCIADISADQAADAPSAERIPLELGIQRRAYESQRSA